jgi:hypothetical protein
LRLTPTYRCQQHGTDAIPVARPQVKGAQPSSGASGLTFASAISGITVYFANVDVPMKCLSFSPSREKRVARPALTAEKVRWLNLED